MNLNPIEGTMVALRGTCTTDDMEEEPHASVQEAGDQKTSRHTAQVTPRKIFYCQKSVMGGLKSQFCTSWRCRWA